MMLSQVSNLPVVDIFSDCVVPNGLEPLQQSMLKVAASIHAIGTDIANCYVDVLQGAGFQPGKTVVMLFGGRLRRQPLKHDSDLDLYIEVANYADGLQGLERNSRFSNCLEDAPLTRLKLTQDFMSRVRDICVRYNVDNHFELRHLGAAVGNIPKKFHPCLVIGVANEVQQLDQPENLTASNSRLS